MLLLAFAGCSLLSRNVVQTITPEPGTDIFAGLSKKDRAAMESIRKNIVPDAGGNAAADSDYRIGGSDVLNITVYDEKDLRCPALRVSPDGYISFPLIGRFKAAGQTTAQLEELIAQKLAPDYIVGAHVSVQVKEFNSKYYVLGEVKKPGAYLLKGSDVSIVEAIGVAGGFTNFAAHNGVKIIRNQNGQETVIRVKVDAITEAGTQLREIILQPHDIVIVPQSFF